MNKTQLKISRLADVCQKISDGIHTTPKYSDSGDYYFINGNNLKFGRIEISKTTKRTSHEEFLKYKKDLTKDTILLSINGTIGNVAFYNDEKIVLGKSAAYLNPGKDIHRDFLFYYLQSDFVAKHFEKGLTGSTIRNLSLKCIKETPIPIFSLSKQIDIAEKLSYWDKCLGLKTKQLQACIKIYYGLMNDIFGNMLDSEERVPLSQFGKVVSGGTPDTTQEKYWGDEIPWLTPSEITNMGFRRFINKTNRNITSVGLKNSSATIFPKGSLIVSTRATVGEVAIADIEMTTNQGFKTIIPDKLDEVDFLYHGIKFLKPLMLKKSTGSTFLELSKSEFVKLRLPRPDKNKVHQISNLLNTSLKKCELVTEEINLLERQKQGVLQTVFGDHHV